MTNMQKNNQKYTRLFIGILLTLYGQQALAFNPFTVLSNVTNLIQTGTGVAAALAVFLSILLGLGSIWLFYKAQRGEASQRIDNPNLAATVGILAAMGLFMLGTDMGFFEEFGDSLNTSQQAGS